MNLYDEIREQPLRHPAGRLLWHFIADAETPEVAAKYVKSRIEAGELYLMVSDWIYVIECITTKATMPKDTYRSNIIRKRDHGRCCITGLKGTLRDPLIVAPVLRVPTGWRADARNDTVDRITPMLYAFFGETYAEWWLRPSGEYPHYGGWAMGEILAHRLGGIGQSRSHWLVRRSAAVAFDRGMVRVDSIKGSEYRFRIDKRQLLGTDTVLASDSYVNKVVVLGGRESDYDALDWRFLDTHARLSMSIRYVEIARDVAPEICEEGFMARALPAIQVDQHGDDVPLRKPGIIREPFPFRTLIDNIIRTTFLLVWLMLPMSVRDSTYQKLKDLGSWPSGSQNRNRALVVRNWNHSVLPFGADLQFQGGYDNEFNALKLVRQHTTIPVPKPLDHTFGPSIDYEKWGMGSPVTHQTLVTHLLGHELYKCLEFMSDEHIPEVAAQLRDPCRRHWTLMKLAFDGLGENFEKALVTERRSWKLDKVDNHENFVKLEAELTKKRRARVRKWLVELMEKEGQKLTDREIEAIIDRYGKATVEDVVDEEIRVPQSGDPEEQNMEEEGRTTLKEDSEDEQWEVVEAVWIQGSG